MSSLQNLIGDHVVNMRGSSVKTTLLFGDTTEVPILGLYFSAHWCPPCREFTPILVQFYKNFKATSAKAQCFEIVFISSDNDEDAYNEYLNEMPWPALPFSDQERRDSLTKQFQVQGIPLLILVDANTGKVITKTARKSIISDPSGVEFPWVPETLSTALLHGKLLKGSEEVDCKQALAGKVKGLYFSSQWCPPCRSFTTDLIKTYQTLQAQGRNFEVVYVSWDRSSLSFNEFFETMPWLAIPFQDPRIAKLAKKFDVKAIPLLILIDEHDELITTEGRNIVVSDVDGKGFPWSSPVIHELSETNAPLVNDAACVLFFPGANMEVLIQALPSLTAVARLYIEDQRNSVQTPTPFRHLNFLYEGLSSGSVADQLKTLVFASGVLGTEPPQMSVVILDLPGQRIHAKFDDEAANIIADMGLLMNLLDDFKYDRLPFMPIDGSTGDK